MARPPPISLSPMTSGDDASSKLSKKIVSSVNSLSANFSFYLLFSRKSLPEIGAILLFYFYLNYKLFFFGLIKFIFYANLL